MASNDSRPSDTINIGAADLFIMNEDGIELYLGLTSGGTTLEYIVDHFDLNSDQTGTIVLDSVETGMSAKVTSNLLNTGNLNILNIVAGAKADGDATTYGRTIGHRASQSFIRLRIHPIAMGRNDNSRDVIIYQCYNKGGLTLEYKSDAMWMLPLEMMAYFDFSRADGDQLFRIGEDSGNTSQKLPEEITIAPRNPADVQVGDVISFSATGIFSDYTTANVTDKATWTTSGTGVVSGQLVGNEYQVTALAAGTSIINANYLGVSTNTAMTVVE